MLTIYGEKRHFFKKILKNFHFFAKIMQNLILDRAETAVMI